MFEASKYCHAGNEKILSECLKHMSGQLSFHLASAVLRISKQSRTGWKEWTPFAWALMTIAYARGSLSDAGPLSSAPVGKEQLRNRQKVWRVDSAYRCSQAGLFVGLQWFCLHNVIILILNDLYFRPRIAQHDL